jgi:bifunctional non-homologous end joining protein LigD
MFVDDLRNGQGATAICPWSIRADLAPVATPVTCPELNELEKANSSEAETHEAVRPAVKRL